MKEIEELEKEYYELTSPPEVSKLVKPGEFPKIETTKSPEFHPAKERINFLEERMDELEKTIALMSKNLDDYRQIVNSKISKIEERKKIPQDIRNEISSLKSLIEKTMEVNEELKRKTPQFLRGLEKKTEEVEIQIKNIRREIRKLRDETEEKNMSHPVILE